MKRLPEVLRKIALIGVVSFGLIGSSATAALAHDEVSSTSPTDGSTVEAGVVNVGVDFNEQQLVVGNNDGIAIGLTAPDGQLYQVSASCLKVEGNTINAVFDLALAGDYAVNYRSVSSDGHASSGGFFFRVTNDNAYQTQSGEPVKNVCSAIAINLGGPTETAMPSTPKTTSDGGLGALYAGLAIFVIATVVAIIVINRRSKRS